MGTQVSLKVDGVSEIFPGMTVVPGGGKTFLVHYLGASGLSDLPAGFAGNPDGFFQSVNAALAGTRLGRGDKIICLPGHIESVSTADFWSNINATTSDVEIVGVGTGTNRPTFTWTAAAATILFDQPNIKLRNCRLFLAGPHVAGSALTVAAPITISADGCEITDCEIAYGFASTQIVGIGITVATANRVNFSRNDCYAETVAVPTTTFLRLTAASWFRADDTRVIGPGSSTTVAPVQFLTTASLKVQFNRCHFANTVASSTVAFTTMAGLTGNLLGCGLGIGTGTAPWTANGLYAADSYYSTGTAASQAVI